MLVVGPAFGADDEPSHAPARTECSDTLGEESDGILRIKFAGTVMGRHPDGSVRPVDGALFETLRDGQRKLLAFSTDASGGFNSEFRLWFNTSTHCENGKIVSATYVREMVIAISTRDCREAQLTFDHKWEPRTVELECN